MKFSKALKIVNWLVAINYTFMMILWYVSSRSISFGGILLAVSLVGAGGLVAQKEWARKLIVTASAVLLIYGIIETFFIYHGLTSLGFTIMLWAGVIVILYSSPSVQRVFKFGFREKGHKLLLVDDDQTFVKLLKHHLSKEDFEVVSAETGEQGLELAKTESPALILLDVILPGLKGREVCDQLKEDGRTRDIPVVFLTHKDSPDDMKAALEGGAVAYLTKPINYKALTDTIHKVLGN